MITSDILNPIVLGSMISHGFASRSGSISKKKIHAILTDLGIEFQQEKDSYILHFKCSLEQHRKIKPRMKLVSNLNIGVRMDQCGDKIYHENPYNNCWFLLLIMYNIFNK